MDHQDIYHGCIVSDPYRWLEDIGSAEVMDWYDAQKKEAELGINQELRHYAESRLKQLYKIPEYSIPSKKGESIFMSKKVDMADILILKTKKNGQKEIDFKNYFDGSRYSLLAYYPSSGGKYTALILSHYGSDYADIAIVDVEKERIVDTIVNTRLTTSVTWKGDEGFFYSTSTFLISNLAILAPSSPQKLYFHKLGSPNDPLIYGDEVNPRQFIYSNITEDGRYLIMRIFLPKCIWKCKEGMEVIIRDLQGRQADKILSFEDVHTSISYLHYEGDNIYFYTDHQAPNGRIIKVSLHNLYLECSEDVIPETKHPISAAFTGNRFFVVSKEEEANVITCYDLQGKALSRSQFSNTSEVMLGTGTSKDTDFYFKVNSFLQPGINYMYHIASKAWKKISEGTSVFDSKFYICKKVEYQSKDGTPVPMTIMHRKDIILDGKNPTLLFGYGGFGVSVVPHFNPEFLFWLENGGVVAVPNIRGGGEKGRSWHLEGIQLNKQNVFDDFISAAEFLVDQQYTNAGMLAILGRSNGGLLVGAVMAQRPDLCRVAFPTMGVLDMLRYHQYTVASAWISEYGAAEDSPEMFHYLLNYSPLHNIKQGVHYPATLVMTADHDDRVVPWHSYKFAAALQYCQEGELPILLYVAKNSGHGQARTALQKAREEAMRFAFAWQAFYLPVSPEH